MTKDRMQHELIAGMVLGNVLQLAVYAVLFIPSLFV